MQLRNNENVAPPEERIKGIELQNPVEADEPEPVEVEPELAEADLGNDPDDPYDPYDPYDPMTPITPITPMIKLAVVRITHVKSPVVAPVERLPRKAPREAAVAHAKYPVVVRVKRLPRKVDVVRVNRPPRKLQREVAVAHADVSNLNINFY